MRKVGEGLTDQEIRERVEAWKVRFKDEIERDKRQLNTIYSAFILGLILFMIFLAL